MRGISSIEAKDLAGLVNKESNFFLDRLRAIAAKGAGELTEPQAADFITYVEKTINDSIQIVGGRFRVEKDDTVYQLRPATKNHKLEGQEVSDFFKLEGLKYMYWAREEKEMNEAFVKKGVDTGYQSLLRQQTMKSIAREYLALGRELSSLGDTIDFNRTA